MSREDDAILEYLSLEPKVYPIVTHVALTQSGPFEAKIPEFRLTMRLSGTNVPATRDLFLVFENVRQLRLTQPEWSLFQVEPFRITSMRDRQWEGINYEIKEEDYLSFMCRSFSARLVLRAR